MGCMKPMPIRYDGLYLSPGDGYTAYLRFYADGDVVTVSSTGEPREVASWFGRGHEKPVRWKLDSERLSFAEFIDFSDRGEPAPAGFIRYSGRFEGEALHLRAVSELTGGDTERVYTFLPIALSA
jgi:hypothetical protein